MHPKQILTQYDGEALLAQDDACTPINLDLLLIESQTTVDLFSNPKHVSNIWAAKTSIKVHCNKGTLATTEEAPKRQISVILWYILTPASSHVLSLYRLGQMFYVTYDSHDCGGVFKVHKSKGIIKFLPTPKDLHALHLKDNPNSALVNDT
jgi:hypothetical protein